MIGKTSLVNLVDSSWNGLLDGVKRTARIPILMAALAASTPLFTGCEEPDIIADPEVPTVPTVPPEPERLRDHGKIFFIGKPIESSVEDNSLSLWCANSDGSGLKELVDSVTAYSGWSSLKLSPDNTKLTFVKKDQHMVIDTSGAVLGTFSIMDRSIRDFSWTRDSKMILCGVYFSGIYSYDLESKTVSRIWQSASRTYDHEPVMSAVTGKIAFVHHSYGSYYDIYVSSMHAMKDSLKLVAAGDSTYYDAHMNLTWLDRNHLVYSNERVNQLLCADVETLEITKIVPSIEHFVLRDVSPDGKSVAASGGPYTDKGIYLIGSSDLISGNKVFKKIPFPAFESASITCNGWSYDSRYFVCGDLYKTLIFDINGKEFRFLDKKDFPEAESYILDIEWAPK